MKTYFALCLSLLLICCQKPEPTDGWITLFNGEDLAGWKASENKNTFSVQDGLLVAHGERSHLFYTGEVQDASFANFEFQAEVMTTPGSNSGIYFYTAYQEEGWPTQGYEAQVSNTHLGAGDYRELKKTGSLYGIRNAYKQLMSDNQWFQYNIKVQDGRVQIRLNDILVVDHFLPEPNLQGTFALQGHDPHSKVCYRNIQVKILEDSTVNNNNPVVENGTHQRMEELMGEQHSFSDLGLDLASVDLNKALDFYYRTGINLGVLLDANEYHQIDRLRGYPVFIGAKNPDGDLDRSSFDYVVGFAGDFPEDAAGDVFMDAYVESIAEDLHQKNLDVWSGAAALPEHLANQWEQLWTEDRLTKVIEAAVTNNVAIEIDNQARWPNMHLIQLANENGAKFTYANLGVPHDMGALDYIFEVIEQAELGYKDIFIP
jgi:hypothetical protein